MKKIILITMGLSLSLFADFSRNNTTNIVTDNYTQLVWQDNERQELTLPDAIEYCEALSLGGHDDWRLPNINELFSIVDYTKNKNINKNININKDNRRKSIITDYPDSQLYLHSEFQTGSKDTYKYARYNKPIKEGVTLSTCITDSDRYGWCNREKFGSFYWSSTYNQHLDFHNATTFTSKSSKKYSVRCVRAGK